MRMRMRIERGYVDETRRTRYERTPWLHVGSAARPLTKRRRRHARTAGRRDGRWRIHIPRDWRDQTGRDGVRGACVRVVSACV